MKNKNKNKITDTQKVNMPKDSIKATYDDMLNAQYEETVAAVVQNEIFPEGADKRECACEEETCPCATDEEDHRCKNENATSLNKELYRQGILSDEELYNCHGSTESGRYQFIDNLNNPNVENPALKKQNNKKIFDAAKKTFGDDGLSDVTNFYSFAENSVALEEARKEDEK